MINSANSKQQAWHELIAKERGHHHVRREFTVNPKTLYVVTEKPQQTSWSREWISAKQAAADRLAPLDDAALANLPAFGVASGPAVASLSPLTHMPVPKSNKPAAMVSPPAAAAALAATGAAPSRTVGSGSDRRGARSPLSVAGATIGGNSTSSSAAVAATTATRSSPAKASSSTASAGATTTTTSALSSSTRASPIHDLKAHPLMDATLANSLLRSDWAPKEKYEWPQTTSHEYGWHSRPIVPPDRATHLWRKGLTSSDISAYVSNYVSTQGGKSPFVSSGTSRVPQMGATGGGTGGTGAATPK